MGHVRAGRSAPRAASVRRAWLGATVRQPGGPGAGDRAAREATGRYRARVPHRFRVPLACALLAAVASLVVIAGTLQPVGGRPSFLVRMAWSEPMARFARQADSRFAFVPPDGHYDGVYFYAIALDPIALGDQSAVLTQPAYRYRSPLYGWLAGVASLGQATLLPWALPAVNVVMLALAAALVALLGAALGTSPWLGLLVALNPGLLVAVTVDTAEPTAMAFIAAGMLAWLGDRRLLAGLLLVGAAFAREIGVVVAAGIALVELAAWWRLRPERPPLRRWLRRLAPLALGPALYLAWWGWLRLRVGAWPTFEPSNLDWPVLATWDTLLEAARMGTRWAIDDIQLGVGMVALLGAALVGVLFGALRALRLRTIADGPVVLAAVLVLSLNWLPMLYPKEMLRNSAILVVLLALSFAAGTVVRRGTASGTKGPGSHCEADAPVGTMGP